MSTPTANTCCLTIDGAPVQASAGQTVLQAARGIGLDIPTLCYLEKCGPLNSCLVCLVKIDGKLVPSCGTLVREGMAVESETEEVHEARRSALELLFSDHVGDCLSPCNRLCPLGLNIPGLLRQVSEEKFGEASATLLGTLPLAGVLGRLCHHPCEQGCRRGHWDEPAAIRDMERFVADWSREHRPGAVAPRPTATGRTITIIGAGPAGLAAAHALVRRGHRVRVIDRHERAGGSLRAVPEPELPPAVMAGETEWLSLMGVEFLFGLELGAQVALGELVAQSDAILLAVGRIEAGDPARLGVPCAGGFIKCDPNTCQTHVPKVFATGASTREVRQLVRAMAEGRAAAECVHRFVEGKPVRRPEKTFSSVMGRLSVGELKQYLAAASAAKSVPPCDRCAGHQPAEAAVESARCLHCECQSSGNCVLQHYAQVYGADAGRYRSGRKPFERHLQPGGVVFEPGKCIVCGICVKLTEMAREPLGLAFVGRGFDVRLAVPFNRSIGEGLQKVAEECVRHCPTGALSMQPARAP